MSTQIRVLTDARHRYKMQRMDSISETTEVLPSWRDVLKDQGRTMTWLASRSGKSHATVQAYAYGKLKAPEAWLAKVSELLGVAVR